MSIYYQYTTLPATTEDNSELIDVSVKSTIFSLEKQLQLSTILILTYRVRRKTSPTQEKNRSRLRGRKKVEKEGV